MNIVVFTGPTLAADEAVPILEATYLPPVSQGDLYRAAREAPDAIGIIDGYFHRVPSVWHKEILWALSRGIRVFGSASMGALRAAELARFGMEGVGWVFEAFQSGELEDDDEVALLQSSIPVKGKFATYSEAMVNIRRTLAKAAEEGVICVSLSEALIQVGKRLYYAERTYERILQLGSGLFARESDIESLRYWLKGNQIDQKRRDAVEMLERMREQLATVGSAEVPEFRFAHTELWQELCVRVHAAEPDHRGLGAEALLRASLLRLAEYENHPTDSTELSKQILEFRNKNLLVDGTDLDRWLDQRGLTAGEFLRLMEDEVNVSKLKKSLSPKAKQMEQDLSVLLRPKLR